MKKSLAPVKVLLLAFIWIGLQASACKEPASDDTTDEGNKTEFTIKRGVNISHWLSQSDIRGTERERILAEKEVEQLHKWGFDFLRLPVDEVQLFKENGEFDMEVMALVERAISWCRKYNMRVIFDLHIVRAYAFYDPDRSLFTSEEQQKHFCEMWDKMARYFEKYPENLLAFEILNEPSAYQNEQWNALAEKTIRTIRQVNKKRVLVIAANQWDDVREIPNLQIPWGDPNIMLTFHFYEPALLTHYQASWKDEFKIKIPSLQYPGLLVSDEDYNGMSTADKATVKPYMKPYDKEWIRSYWMPAIQFAKKNSVTLFLGEFGCLPSVGNENRINWVRDVVDLCDEYNIPRAYWEYKSAFGFCSWEGGWLIYEDLKNTLTK